MAVQVLSTGVALPTPLVGTDKLLVGMDLARTLAFPGRGRVGRGLNGVFVHDWTHVSENLSGTLVQLGHSGDHTGHLERIDHVSMDAKEEVRERCVYSQVVWWLV